MTGVRFIAQAPSIVIFIIFFAVLQVDSIYRSHALLPISLENNDHGNMEI